MVKLIKVTTKEAKPIATKTVKALKPWQQWLSTMTSDNGLEFACHQIISEKLNLDFNFAKPYHSWERGSNENLNGLIRQYIPKQTDLQTITPKFLKNVENKLNSRPRKRFGFLTPIDIFNQLTSQTQKVAFVT